MDDALVQQDEQEEDAWADFAGIDVEPSDYRETCADCWLVESNSH